MSQHQLDLGVVADIAKDVYQTSVELDGQIWDDDAVSNAKKAEMSRRINHMSDQLILAASLVRNEYWAGKGFKDPLVMD